MFLDESCRVNVDCGLTVSLGPVLQTEGEGELGLVLEELVGEGVPPEVVTVLRPLLQPLVHLEYLVVGLQHWHGSPVQRWSLELVRAS